jgi:hypothetical protein
VLPEHFEDYNKIYGKFNKKEEKKVREDIRIPVVILNPCPADKSSLDNVVMGIRLKI